MNHVGEELLFIPFHLPVRSAMIDQDQIGNIRFPVPGLWRVICSPALKTGCKKHQKNQNSYHLLSRLDFLYLLEMKLLPCFVDATGRTDVARWCHRTDFPAGGIKKRIIQPDIPATGQGQSAAAVGGYTLYIYATDG